MTDKTRPVGWRMPEHLYKHVKKEAFEDNRSFSNMLNECVRLGVKVIREGRETNTHAE